MEPERKLRRKQWSGAGLQTGHMRRTAGRCYGMATRAGTEGRQRTTTVAFIRSPGCDEGRIDRAYIQSHRER